MTIAIRESFKGAPDDDGERLRLVREFVRTAQDDAASAEDVSALVADDPGTTGDPGWDAAVAGVAEWVAGRLGGIVPEWTDDPGRFLDVWWHAETTGFGRAGALANAPAALRRRGVLIDPLGLVSDGVEL
ncbi:MAG: hypothetical protein ACR2KP_04925 [Egibacteraceae bacterium]